MDQTTFVSRPAQSAWEPPAAEEIRVSAEVTMYMGAWEDQDWL
jgi:coenzyme PQQ precursor peptide PqqA